MACGGCQQRRQLIGQAVRAIQQGQPIRPIAKAFGASITADLRRTGKPLSPRLVRPK